MANGGLLCFTPATARVNNYWESVESRQGSQIGRSQFAGARSASTVSGMKRRDDTRPLDCMGNPPRGFPDSARGDKAEEVRTCPFRSIRAISS
jgi:hypothetical protein